MDAESVRKALKIFNLTNHECYNDKNLQWLSSFDLYKNFGKNFGRNSLGVRGHIPKAS